MRLTAGLSSVSVEHGVTHWPASTEPAGADGAEADDQAGVGPCQDARHSGGAGIGTSKGWAELSAIHEARVFSCLS